jgi:hypothetical protein
MTPSRPPDVKYSVVPNAQKGLSVKVWGAWLFAAYIAVIVVVAISTGYIFASIFFGVAVLPLIQLFDRDISSGQVLAVSATALILIGLGLLFIVPWSTSSGPGLTNDDRYQKLLNESAYSCQPEHYDQQNCRAQKQGLDADAKWYNEQRR